MIRATVVGRVWATKKLEQVPPGSLVEVSVIGSTSSVIAFDPLGCGDGEQVLVATGSVAAAWFKGAAPPVDALIVGIIDESVATQNRVEK
jgi:ethanolamine utilization protein EutN